MDRETAALINELHDLRALAVAQGKIDRVGQCDRAIEQLRAAGEAADRADHRLADAQWDLTEARVTLEQLDG